MGHDYGPPDPPPQMETETLMRMLAFETQEQVLRWIEYHNKSSRPNTFRIFKVEGVKLVTEVKLSLS
ncbi:hypothetical protein D3C84_1161280 [compost metagenome]